MQPTTILHIMLKVITEANHVKNSQEEKQTGYNTNSLATQHKTARQKANQTAESHANQQPLAVGTGAPLPFPTNATGLMKMLAIFHIWTPDHLTLVLWLYTNTLKTV